MAASRPGGRWSAGLRALALLAGLGIASYLVAHHENKVYGDATVGLANGPETETLAYAFCIGGLAFLDSVPLFVISKTLGLDLRSYRAPKGGLASRLDPGVAEGIRALLSARGSPSR